MLSEQSDRILWNHPWLITGLQPSHLYQQITVYSRPQTQAALFHQYLTSPKSSHSHENAHEQTGVETVNSFKTKRSRIIQKIQSVPRSKQTHTLL
jgi:hypothetical protein